ncbi:glycosyltransferase family 2 protein [Acetobacter sp. TBRC 12305]|uniref:Glycosyltransferase family 2 protein n=1 Tax=Acetobacter garciniae TaxID=2817435 RepID=A0A939HPI3_9PROT|nr:glycosyltransferase family A protein [Acetobacter garciniae]MBO1324901.1 glycosyltransferase family 2 protein [Acetobacter garciniae]MBX0344592.1 glycosyltransferase family 2 protein [Acetobacter garciniae]
MSVLKPWDPVPDIAFLHKKKTRKPKNLVSVCVTNFNYAALIGDCLDSIARQTHRDLEIVVVDDCSGKDASVQVITDWMAENRARFYSLKCLVNRRNQGPSFARNMAFEHALSDVVFIIDADNMAYPTALEKLYAALQEGPFPAVYPQLEEFGGRQGVGSADLWDATRMRRNNYVDVMALIRKTAWETVGGFSHIERGWEDYDFWLKFIDHGLEPAYLPEILCRYRVHDQSRTATDALAAHYDLELVMEFRHPSADNAEP